MCSNPRRLGRGQSDTKKKRVGDRWFCIASGPSLTKEDAEKIKGKGKVAVVNDCYRLAPWADILYAADPEWWDYHHRFVAESFQGECWTQSKPTAECYGLNHIPGAHANGLGPDRLYFGRPGNSGYQAVNLVYLLGAAEIVLLGYDMGGGSHWFGEHPPELRKNSPYNAWVASFRSLARDLEVEGVTVINCSRRTNLDCVPCKDLEQVV